MSLLKSVDCYLISDGIMWTDGGGAFGLVPKPIWEQRLPPDEYNRVPFALNNLLIRSEGKTILVDTGCGTKLAAQQAERIGLDRSEGDLLAALARLNVSPDDIDIVVNTHLHFDHCAGNTMVVGEKLKPTFPNAEYLVQRLEFADAITPNERTRATYFAENILPIQESGQLKLIDGNVSITSQVRTAIARGHTRSHQLIIVEADHETALFIADMASLHYHFERLAWVAGYDVEPLESIETKRFWQQWVMQHDALLVFQHDTQIPVGKLERDGRRFKVVAAKSNR